MEVLIQTYQLPLILICFAIGSAATLMLFRRPASPRAWQVADLIWVLLGGIGAITAIVAGIYQDDSTRLDRQISVAYAATRAFDFDAAQFRLRHCAPPDGDDVRQLCDKVEFLSASTAGNSALPLFISLTEQTNPLRGVSLLYGSPRDMATMAGAVTNFDPAEFLNFDTRDVDTVMALDRLAPISRPSREITRAGAAL